ncbi:hypothetical protein ACH4VR_41230 [Streptomyces sp. NPDC020883]|uniref:hypothetical protein n=1 Tax=Streptomyces sp. NPDC020883 TaxID=3365099 RepID=UPI0037BB1B0D
MVGRRRSDCYYNHTLRELAEHPDPDALGHAWRNTPTPGRYVLVEDFGNDNGSRKQATLVLGQHTSQGCLDVAAHVAHNASEIAWSSSRTSSGPYLSTTGPRCGNGGWA